MPIGPSNYKTIEAYNYPTTKITPRSHRGRRCDFPRSDDRASVLAGSTAVRAFHVPLEAPAVDHLGVETPVGADPEARQLSATEQLVDC